MNIDELIDELESKQKQFYQTKKRNRRDFV